MLTALSPTAALRADLERAYRGDTATGSAEQRDDLAAWTLVATVLGRLDALPADERPAHASRAGRALAARAVAPETGTPARPATAALARTLARWGRGAARGGSLNDLVAAARDVVEDMERAGALSLARTSLVALLGSAAAAGDAAHGLTLAHLGRVVRQMGELDAAVGLYEAAARLAERAGDATLAARAAVGRGVLFWQRGNYPAAREAYARALQVAPARSAIAAGAHHGLMLTAIGAGDLEAALRHGWRAFADAGDEPDRRAEALINLGGLCRRVGDHAAALHAFRASLALTPTPRLRLPAICSAALAAAQSGAVRLVTDFAHQADEVMAVVAQPYEEARAQLEIAEALATAGHETEAAGRFDACRELAAQHGFHELAWRAETARQSMAAASSAPAATRGSATVGEDVVERVRRLPLAAAELLALR